MPIENVTPNRGYQLPAAPNDLVDDVARLIAAVTGIDLDVASILAALLTKSEVGHEHVIGDITGLAAALAARQEIDQKGQANGYASLGDDGKVPAAQLPAVLFGAMSYQGTWNASTNNPVIPAATATNKGHYYKVSVAGTTTISGVNDWEIGDWVVSNGVSWDKIDNTDQVLSVAGLRGAITAVALKAALEIAVADIAGLGNSATRNVGTGAGTVADGVAALQYKGAIGASEDLDAYTTPGVYVQNQSAGASGGTNYPVANAGMLEVLDGGGATNVQVVQRYTSHQDRMLYTRMRRNSGAWSAWEEFVTQSTLPPSTPPSNKRVITSSTTWDKPDGLVKAAIYLVGGGGGGARNTSAGGGGGGGGGAIKTILAADLNDTETIEIGAGGAGRTGSNGAGSDGGTTSFGSHFSATGGKGGSGSTSGAGGVGVGGDVNYRGGETTDYTAASGALFYSHPGMTALTALPNTGSGTPIVAGGTNGANGGSGIVIIEEYF